MRFMTLGRYGRFAPPGDATSGYVIKTDNAKIVVDFGSGCLSKLLAVSDVDGIDLFILTHLHYDHMSDIFILAYFLQLYKRRMLIYCPTTPIEVYNSIAKFECFDIIPLSEKTEIIIGDLHIMPIPASHPIETYSLVIDDNSARLVYTSDIKDTFNLDKYLMTATAIIGDACVLQSEHTSNSPHISVKDLAQATPLKTILYLAHLPYGGEDKVVEEAIRYHQLSQIVTSDGEV